MKPEQRTFKPENVVVKVGEGKPTGMDQMMDWMLRVLSDGNVSGYALSVIERAEAATAVTA